MNRRSLGLLGIGLGLLVTLLSTGMGICLADPQSPLKTGEQVSVQSFADQDAISPGQTFNLAVSLKIQNEWHVYWRSPGGSTGMPTEFQWTGPTGYQFGRTLYPVPKEQFDKELNETSFLIEGSPVFITPVRVPANATVGKDATFKVKVSWLACKKSCIPGDAEVSLSLPVVANGKTKTANEKLFAKARTAMPVPTEKAEHVKLSGQVDKKTVKPKDKFTATIVADIAAKHHMQSHTPLQSTLVSAFIFAEQTSGLDIGEVAYPVAHERVDKTLGKLSEYFDIVNFKLPVTVADDADKKPRWIRGVIRYQVCNDAGTCYRPEFVEFAIPVQMEGGAVPVAEGVDSPAAAAKTGAASPDNSKIAKPASQAQKPSSPAKQVETEDPRNVLTRLQDWLLGFGYTGALMVALIGGFILNLMPCVLPVISLKILSFVKQAHEDRGQIFRLGLTYAAGIIIFFGFIGVFYWQTNRQFGWGEFFQKPHVVLGLAAIVTAFAMSLFGVFALFPPKVINTLGQKAEGSGYASAFATGLLATFLGTACTAPFLSAALGAASRFSPSQGAGIFLAVGVGMALPFVLLAANPGWLRFVPRPGPWMMTFEYVMGFFLLGTVVWLLNPLRGQIGDYGLLLSLIFLLAVSMAVWVKGKIEFGAPVARKAKLYTVALLILIGGWLLPFRVMANIEELVSDQLRREELIADGAMYQEQLRQSSGGKKSDPSLAVRNLDWSHGIPWQRYKRDRALTDVKNGYTVFIDYTADWCGTCKTMLKTAIERNETIAVMRELNIIPYSADYTLRMPEIAEDLKRFKRGGVPVFVVYHPGDPDHPEILPEVITSGSLVEALRRAGPSHVQLARKP